MNSFSILIVAELVFSLALAGNTFAQEFRASAQPLIQDSCIHCHDGSEENGLDFSALGNDLNDDSTFRKWVRIHDRVATGEMPPASEGRPGPEMKDLALSAVKDALTVKNRRLQKDGRVILRRLTRTEFQNSINDLLSINAELGGIIPAENASAGFDTVFTTQGISPLHIQSYFEAVDAALDTAIRFQPKPESNVRRYEYVDNKFVRAHLEKDKEHPIARELKDAIVMFNNASYVYKLDHHLSHDGWYTLRARARAFQSKKPVVLTLNAGSYQRGFTETLGFFDLDSEESRIVETKAYLTAGQYLFPGVADLEHQPDGNNIWNVGPEKYQGSGIALEWIEIEGPLVDQWPPSSTTKLLNGVELKSHPQKKWSHQRQEHYQYEIVPGENPAEQLTEIVVALAPRAFRRELSTTEIQRFVDLGIALQNEGREFEEAIRVMLRAILTSPNFLFLAPDSGRLDPNSLATRLSLFLWKSIPDKALLALAADSQFASHESIQWEVDRMLADPKSERFIQDFVRQWLRLGEIDATAPDRHLYPEFDEILKSSMISETERFIAYLIENDLSVSNLIDSDFAFLNRRLAEHYDIDGVVGQEIRKFDLPPGSKRGGLLTQASILKVTANGTTTSPVMRGSWVLTHLLGTPPSPPPPTVGSIEPDTRGTKTIREMLNQHRNEETCARCHRAIDPPGFALESFDVIGGYRNRFRTRGEGDRVVEKLNGRNIWEYKLGLPVDASGQLATGESFDGIDEFKRLLGQEKEQVARNLISQLVVYSTGAEIQFVDRDRIEEILELCRESDFGLRTIIHQVVLSELFLNK